jgi:uncharacterized membrane protein YvbJ
MLFEETKKFNIRLQMYLQWSIGVAVGMGLVIGFLLLTGYRESQLEKQITALKTEVSELTEDLETLRESNIRLWKELEPHIMYLRIAPEKYKEILDELEWEWVILPDMLPSEPLEDKDK